MVEVLRMFMNSYYKLKYKINGCFDNCDAIIFANKETQDFLDIKGRIITEVAIPNVNGNIRNKIINGKCVFLVAGRLIYRKGHRLLLDAICTMPKDADYEVRIIGSGEETPILKKIVNGNDILRKHVRFVPKMPYTEMCCEYEKADVFIMPSIRETTGSVLLEAMGYGLPVIAIDKFGSGLILNNNLGWTFSGSTRKEYITSLAKAIEYCISHPEEVRRRGENMLKEAHRYTWEEKVDTFNVIYKEILT